MFENLCRICAKKVNDKDATNLFANKIFLVQLKDLTGVRLKNHFGLPKLMCRECKEDLFRAYKFRDDFLKVQASFKINNKKANKNNASSSLIEATEFVQLFVVKEESYNSDIHNGVNGEDEEKEINIDEPQEFVKKETNHIFDDNEVNALELKPNEENTLQEAKISLESNCDTILDNFDMIKSVSDDDGEMSIRYPNEKRRSETKVIGTAKKYNRKCKKVAINGEQDFDIEKPKSVKMRKTTEEHPNIFICDQCGNHFTCRHHFKLHLRRHTGDKRCACELCPDKFFTSSELKRHMRKHTGERPFACKYCDRRFTDYSTRIKHERTHTNERPFICTQCGKSFTTSYILKNHMLTHTGERHFKCDLCNRSFTRRTHLVVHFRSIMHKQAVEKDKRPISQEELSQPHRLIPQSKHISTFLV